MGGSMNIKTVFLSFGAAFIYITMSSQFLLAAQQPLNAVGKKATGDYVTQIRTDFNAELAKQQAMNTELYTSLSSAEAFLSVWGWSPGSGNVDLTSPGPIGSVTANTGKFTALQADSLNIVPPSGETGEMAVHEDPASSGDDWVGFKAPMNVAPGGIDGDLLWVLPSTDGAAGQVMSTDGASNLSWVSPLLQSALGTMVQAYDEDLADLADGTLTGSKVGTGIIATNITTGTLPVEVLPSTVMQRVAAPTAATSTCTAGSAAYDTSYIYVCIATDTWLRAPISTW